MKLPHNEQAERIVISTIVQEGSSALLKALDYKVSDAWFYNPFCKAVWKQLNECHVRGKGLDAHVICEEMRRVDPDLKRVGGLANFADITGAAQTSISFVYSLDRIKELYQAREIAVVAAETQ